MLGERWIGTKKKEMRFDKERGEERGNGKMKLGWDYNERTAVSRPQAVIVNVIITFT